MARALALTVGLLGGCIALAPGQPIIRPAPMPRGWKPSPHELWIYCGGIPQLLR